MAEVGNRQGRRTAITTIEPPTQAGQALLDALRELHLDAGEPSQRRISKLIENGPYDTTVSRESVRTVLNGRASPRWHTVKAITMALAGLCTPSRDADAEAARMFTLWSTAHGGRGSTAGVGTRTSDAAPEEDAYEVADGAYEVPKEEIPDFVLGVIGNPFSAIEIDPRLAVPHEPFVSEESWIENGVKMMSVIGPENFLRLLLDSLKGDFTTSDDGSSPYGYHFDQHSDGDGDEGEDEETEHAEIEADVLHDYLSRAIVRRLAKEPSLLARSINVLRETESVVPEVLANVQELESDAAVLREAITASPDTWDDLSYESHRLVIYYLVEQVRVLGPSVPLDEQVTIIWRVPEPSADGA
ncbi:hypothetical protein [Streptomyces viridochromogenes]|uniref:hypothetical protein n=1 Tax=Streptomyces viridochromogenes TaxID=1938 RepID=UPI00131BA230|nr:hypothetical protein [Streptomyces viridochromogenes]